MDARARSSISTAIDPSAPIVWDRDSILFSACNEDTRSELRALQDIEGKRLLCITAGGGRVLGLLVGRPKSIVAVDLNPAQNALLELKIAALRELDHDGYLRFLGVRPSTTRLATYEKVRSHLSPGAQGFFDRAASAIAAGILYQGKLERYLGKVALVTRLAGPFGLRQLLEAEDLSTQRAFVARLETPAWRLATQTLCRRKVLELLSGDPGFYRHLPEDLPLHEILYDRIHNNLRNNLLRENPLLQLVFFGRYAWEPTLPVYLHADTFGAVKSALENVELEIVTATVSDVLSGAGRKGFDAFSLSDISSYLDDEAHHLLFDRVFTAAHPGARLCSRANIHHRPLALEQARRLEREPALERELARRDHACVHEFVVGAMR